MLIRKGVYIKLGKTDNSLVVHAFLHGREFGYSLLSRGSGIYSLGIPLAMWHKGVIVVPSKHIKYSNISDGVRDLIVQRCNHLGIRVHLTADDIDKARKEVDRTVVD